MQFKNNSFILVTLFFLNLFKFNSIKEEQLLNILSMFIRDSISEFIIKVVKFEQFENIYSIFSTLFVSKFDKFRISKLEQLVNIFSIFFTLLVSKLDKDREFNE